MSTKNYPPNFTFIIPTLTNREGLLKVLKNLEVLYPQAPCLVVNNNRGALELEKYNLKLEVIDQGKNTGFAKAVNDGAKRAKSQYLVFLNDDVEFKSPWVEKCVVQMEKENSFACSPILKNKNGEIENTGYRVLPFGKVELNKNPSDKNIDGLTAAALVVNSNRFNELGGFDEKFFAYLEDVDLFLRAKRNGLKFAVNVGSFVNHDGQTTSDKFKTKKAWLDFRNWIRVINKNWSRKELLSNFPSILLERGRNLFGVIKSLS